MTIYVVVFGTTGGQAVEYASVNKADCHKYLDGYIVKGSQYQFIHAVELDGIDQYLLPTYAR